MRTCLEKRSMEERHEEIIRNNYTADNQYNATHPDALATGDAQGKGTGHGGHSHWLPDCNAQPNVFNYSNFDTDPASGAGNDVDNEKRKENMVRSLYSSENQYTEATVDTSANVREGQYVVP